MKEIQEFFETVMLGALAAAVVSLGVFMVFAVYSFVSRNV
jgi:hypothetical protein